MNNPKIAYLNINHLRNKVVDLRYILKDINPTFLAISETKLDDSFPNAQFNINGYLNVKEFRRDRNKNGGGLLAYIKKGTPVKRIKNYEHEEIETLAIELKIGSQKWCIVSVYRSEQTSVDHFLSTFSLCLDKIYDKYQNVIVIGDININSLENRRNNDKSKFEKLKHFCDTYDLHNLIKSPTCFQSEEPTSLDVILTNKRRSFMHSKSIQNGLSDHHSLICTMLKTKVKKVKPNVIRFRCMKHFNEKEFLTELKIVLSSLNFNNPKNDFSKFANKFLQVLDKHAPIKTKITRGNDAPFMTSDLRREIRHRSRLSNKAFKLKTSESKCAFKRQRNKCTNLLRESQTKYFENINDGRDKHFWKVIKPFMNDKGNHGIEDYILEENGQIIQDPKAIGNVFCDYYTHIVENTTGSKPLEFQFSENDDKIKSIIDFYATHSSIDRIKQSNHNLNFAIPEASEEDIRNIILKLDVSKANGVDKISAKIVKLSIDIISKPLHTIINRCIKKGKFPDIMKIARIIPCYKSKGDRLDKQYYRPVSVLTCFSKIFERYILNSMLSHVNEILSDKISAYRQGYSCQHVLMHLIDKWRQHLDQNEYIGAVLMDLSKAFDCLPHELLIAKMEAYGFENGSLKLFYNYLKQRKQTVSINGEMSDYMDILAGVPQGSILGPILFNIFINDLMQVFTHTELSNFADDNSLSKAGSSVEPVIADLEHDSQIAIEWFTENKLIANPDKFKAILISRKGDLINIPLNINGEIIKSKKDVTLLGIKIDNQLTLSDHIGMLCKSAANQLNSIKRLKRHFVTKTKRILVKTFVLSQFNYCPLVWHFCKPGDTHKIEKIHERAIRFIYNDYTNDFSTILNENGESSLYLKRVRTMAHEIYKSLNGLNPTYMKELLKSREKTMRRPLDLYIPRVKQITYGERSFKFEAPSLWNSLPLEIRGAENLKLFKYLMKTWTGPSCRCSSCAYNQNGNNVD